MYQTPYSILNFNCPDYLKQDIDEICRFRRISRTALINTFFERVVEEWKPKVDEFRNRQGSVNQPHSNQFSPPSDDEEENQIPFFSNQVPVYLNGGNKDW